MIKKLSQLILPLTLLACNFITGGNVHVPSPVEGGPAQATTATPDEFSTTSFTITRINSQNGSLFAQLADEVQKAKSAGQLPFIEFDATWCPPCQAIDASLKSGESRTTKAFESVYLIRADVDDWGWGDGKKFKFSAIPIYYKLDDQGFPTGATLDGGAWNEDIPENFAPVLDAFFHTP
jgi:thiol-disulfide isomerase/thioredoxin